MAFWKRCTNPSFRASSARCKLGPRSFGRTRWEQGIRRRHRPIRPETRPSWRSCRADHGVVCRAREASLTTWANSPKFLNPARGSSSVDPPSPAKRSEIWRCEACVFAPFVAASDRFAHRDCFSRAQSDQRRDNIVFDRCRISLLDEMASVVIGNVDPFACGFAQEFLSEFDKHDGCLTKIFQEVRPTSGRG